MSEFAGLLADFVADELAADPVRASHLGAPGYDDALPDLSAAGVAAARRREEDYARRFASYGDDELDGAERIDRDLALLALRGRAIRREWGDWQRDAESYLEPALFGLFTTFLHRMRPEPELAASARARLAAMPDLLAAARDNLDPDLASPLLVRRAVGHARGAVDYLREWLPREAPGLDEPAGHAADAVEEHGRWLAAFAERARGDWRLGEARYTALLQESEGLGFGAGELHERGRAAYEELAADLARRALDFDGSTDWRALSDRLNADAPPTLDAMREEYAAWAARARAFCLERDLVTLPAGERCEVVPSPPHERAITAVAFYYDPPLLARGVVGHFFVPYPPDGSDAETVRQRLASNSRVAIPTTAVHEAYPGHHWHLSWLSAACERPLRKLLHSSYFLEGWALYAEQLFREHGFYADPRHEIGQVEARLFRAARIVLDTALHCGDMAVEDATTYLRERVGMSEETARAEVVRYCAWPTQASAYLTGALEIDRMRRGWTGSLRDFHDRLAGSGMLPLGLAERALHS
jgi:uncharacterized protein (DUF885 family)